MHAQQKSIINVVTRNIPQVTSWSRLKISFSMFSRLCYSFQLMPTFLELITTFGYRQQDSDNYFCASFYRPFHEKSSVAPYPQGIFHHIRCVMYAKLLDICYNMRYVDFHGRKTQDPWSFRNFAVYHRSFASGHSTWIFVNLPTPLKEHVTETMKDAGNCDHTFWHLSFFKFCIANWRQYINFLDDRCQKIVRSLHMFVFVNLTHLRGKRHHSSD